MKKPAAPARSVDEAQPTPTPPTTPPAPEVAKTPPGRDTYIRSTDRAVMVEIAPHCYLNAELVAFVGRGRVT
jgi:hypothetical protein